MAKWERTHLVDAPSHIRGIICAGNASPATVTHSFPGWIRHMLACQRALFDIPRDVCFLNAAAWSPLPLAVQEAGHAGVARKGQPWKLDAKFMAGQHERARQAAAALIGAAPEDVALIPSVGYGVSTAGKVLALPSGSRVLVLQDDHTAPVL